MAKVYADEQFPLPVVKILRELGHDVLTVQESNNTSISDEEVLFFAIQEQRIVLTQNRRHFIRLHQQHSHHTGIVVCTEDRNVEQLAQRIHQVLSSNNTLRGQLIRVTRSA